MAAQFPEPTTDLARSLRERVSSERWGRIVAEAQQRTAVVEAVIAWREEHDAGWSASVAAAAPYVRGPTFVRWLRHVRTREGPIWERLLDGRVPPDTSIAPQVKLAAVMARTLDPDIGVRAAREALMKHFAEQGNVSDSWLKRVWAEAGVNRASGATGSPRASEQVESFHGGALLALLAGAEAEVGAVGRLGTTVLDAGKRNAEQQRAAGGADVRPDHEDRDGQGRFTGDYNERRRRGVAAGERDDRWRGDAHKAEHRDLGTLATLRSRPENLAGQLLMMGATPLLTERRGFDGLSGPAGGWFGVTGHTAYMPATLDKRLAELALLDVGAAMWATHVRTWVGHAERWRGDGEAWLQSVVYIDGTADPYWTGEFAASGKVSRVGRVMPCLTRIAIHGGAGVPLLVETHAGSASLKKRLLPMLEQLDAAIGANADVVRMTVVDSEVGTAGLIWAMHDNTEMLFVTVIKGAVLQGATIVDEGEWEPYRERDRVREVEIRLSGKDAPAEGIRIRGVEMARHDGRRPKSTFFVTNATTEDVPTTGVPSWYLGRWPHQEQHFGNGRNGGGLNRSHGYGGEHVAHLALQGKLERAERSVEHSRRQVQAAEGRRAELDATLDAAAPAVRKKALALADADLRAKRKRHDRATDKRDRLQTQPAEIYVRDTRRDSVMTCLKLAVLCLLEFVMQEYFGGRRMQWRSLIEAFGALPVTVRTTRSRRVYEIEANPRAPQRMEQLAAALEAMNHRRIMVGKRRLVYRLVDAAGGVHVRRSGSP